jgi:hypothetical protein
MKKRKAKADKRQEMPEFNLKEFTAEESRIYDEAIASYRDALAAGRTLKEAYDSYTITDPGLRSIIQADFLKIIIAERHFGKREALDALALSLGVTHNVLQETLARMLQEVGVSSANQFAEEFGSLDPGSPKTND